MVNKKTRAKIIKNYTNLRFPGSFQGVSTFRQSLKDNLNIDITHKALRKILKSFLPFQVNILKPKKFKKRANYSRGVYIECYCDIVFFPIPTNERNKNGALKTKNSLALFYVDVHSRMLYTTKVASVNPQCLKKGFNRLFKKGMATFSIMRVDRDKSLNLLANNYFANKGILLLVRRSIHHMGFMESIIRNVKKKFLKNLMENKNNNEWTEKRLERALADVTYSYNNTKNSKTGFTPASCNFPEFDPELRRRLYKEQKIERFEDLYTETLRLHKKANTPEKNENKPNFDESPNSFKRNDLVYIDFKKSRVGNTAYARQRGSIYKISRVNVQSSPYLYKLSSITTGKDLYGWYYGLELGRADLSDLEIERIISRKTSPDKRKLIKVKFKGLDDSYNRWIEEPDNA